MSAVQSPDVSAMLALVGGGWEHSKLYRFLREHHDAIVAKASGERMDWQSLCSFFGEAGLTNLKGETPTVSCARKTWYRVRKGIAALRAKLADEAEGKARERERRKLEREAAQEKPRHSNPALTLSDVAAKPWEVGKPSPTDRFQGKRPTYSPEVLAACAPARYPVPQEAPIGPAAASARNEAKESATGHYFRERPADPMLELMAIASAEELERSDIGWPGQLPREAWGEVRIVTQEWCDATEKLRRNWEHGPDLIGVPGLEALPLKMTFEREKDWLRCWEYLLRKRQKSSNARPLTFEDDQLLMAFHGARLEFDTMKRQIEMCRRMGKKIPALWTDGD